MASIDQRLQRAQEAALRNDQRLESVLGWLAIPIREVLIDARAILTIEGASSLELTLHDPDWRIEESGRLDLDDDGRLGTVDVVLDTLAFRLAQARRTDPDTLQLTFEDRAVQLLREHTGPLTVSRGKMTRAQFIEKMVGEVKTHPIPFYSPEKGIQQAAAAPDFPDPVPGAHESGFDQGTSFKIARVPADGEQKRQVATALGVADQEGATKRAKLALLVAGIGESGFRAIPNTAGSGYAGVFQADPANIPMRDTAQQARYFLKGGKGFQAGGAIAAARANPGWSPGTIAYKVEGSRTNFTSDAAAEHHYGQWRDEAEAILHAWSSGSGTDAASEEVVRFKAYQFMRGLPGGKREDSFEAATRLAEEVNWRFFVAASIAAFISDDRLMMNRALVTLDGPRDDGLLERPTYDWDHGKLAGEVELRVNANRWAIPPGCVWALRGGFGPVEGRWIAHTIEQSLLDATDTRVTLIKPLSPRKEPAPEPLQTTSGTVQPDAKSDAGKTLAWARSKIGHFKEEFANRGDELDQLEATFGMTGEPWCAIFATTAVAQSVGSRCKTAAVATIRQWAQEGSHGYQRGFRASAKPGDLLCLGSAHVALIEKVHSDGSLQTIEGNTSANKVARLNIRHARDGDLVRPDYLD
jgi:hypothetical protein